MTIPNDKFIFTNSDKKLPVMDEEWGIDFKAGNLAQISCFLQPAANERLVYFFLSQLFCSACYINSVRDERRDKEY